VSEVKSDLAAWARDHEVCFELGPLVEMVKGRRVQVGFTLGLYARLPLKTGPGPEREAAARAIWERLREIAQSLAPRKGSRARVEVEGPRAAAFFDPGGRLLPEIAFNARVSHGDDYFAEATAGEEERLRSVTRRLTEMGLKERRPSPR
jgi:hypothetical protein